MELLAIATVPDDVKDDVVDERAKHRTGRVYFPGFVQSFEVSNICTGKCCCGLNDSYIITTELYCVHHEQT